MKKILSLLSVSLVMLFLYTSCGNNEEAGTEGISVEAASGSDTSKTKIDINPEGVSVETKGGTQVSVGSEGGEVSTKNLDVKVKPGGNK